MSTNNELEKKPRKVASGPVRDKSRTMERMVSAVGKVILHYGYAGLTPGNIIAEAKVDRKLLYVHFGTLEQLIEAYVKQKAFVLLRLKSDLESRFETGKTTVRQFKELFVWSFAELFRDKEVIKLIHWELGEDSRLLDAFTDAREELEGSIKQCMLRLYNEDSNNIQSSFSLLLGSPYYLLMQKASPNPSFKDTSTVENDSGIEGALSKLVGVVFGK